MHYYGGWFWGMHLAWWLFGIVLIVFFFGLLKSVPRSKSRETPLQVLQRRYAGGEISTAKYEDRKSNLERNAASGAKA